MSKILPKGINTSFVFRCFCKLENFLKAMNHRRVVTTSKCNADFY